MPEPCCAPRQMFPPPTTTAICTPRFATSAISDATTRRTSGLIPYPVVPMSASPEILRSTRLYAGLDDSAIGADSTKALPIVVGDDNVLPIATRVGPLHFP